MGFLSCFRTQQKSSAQIAKERLQIVIAHQRNGREHDFLPELQKELLQVIRKYVTITEEDIRVNVDKQGDCEVLELNITMPDSD